MIPPRMKNISLPVPSCFPRRSHRGKDSFPWRNSGKCKKKNQHAVPSVTHAIHRFHRLDIFNIIRHSFVIHCLSEICKTFSRLINIFLCINHYCFSRSEVKYIRNIFFFHFRLYTLYQKRTRLNFGTKLGMNSLF